MHLVTEEPITIPSAYAKGYEAAWKRDPEFAEAYIRHTNIGDPLADPVAEDLVEWPSGEVHALLARVLQNPDDLPGETPESLRHFIAEVNKVPDWFDEDIARVASRAFLRNSGQPISAATMLLAGSAFSGRLMQHVATLGGDFSKDEREAYVHVWRYTGLLIGIPEELLFHDEASAVTAFEVGRLCEPTPDEDAIIMANSIVNSSPLVIGINEPEARRKLATFVYRVCRELIGNDLADSFLFPKGRRKVIPFFRAQQRTKRLVRKVIPSWRTKSDLARFNALVDFVNLGKLEHSYSLPTAVHDEDSAEW